MKKIFLLMVGLIVLNGCTSTEVEQVKSKEELKYKRILVMPFTQGEGANAALAKETFISELSLLPGVEIVGQGQMDETTIKNLGVSHPESFGSLDFSASAQGDERRKKVLESFAADVLVFGYNFNEQGLASLNIQMIEATSGDGILGFTKEASVSEGFADDVGRDLARKSAQKTIDFLKGNVIITHIYRR